MVTLFFSNKFSKGVGSEHAHAHRYEDKILNEPELSNDKPTLSINLIYIDKNAEKIKFITKVTIIKEEAIIVLKCNKKSVIREKGKVNE